VSSAAAESPRSGREPFGEWTLGEAAVRRAVLAAVGRAAKRGRIPVDADDLVQDVMINMLRFKFSEPPKSEGAVLAAVAGRAVFNQIISMVRYTGRRRTVPLLYANTLQDARPQREFHLAEVLASLDLEGLDLMPQILGMMIEGKTVRQIAAELEVSTRAVVDQIAELRARAGAAVDGRGRPKSPPAAGSRILPRR